MFRLPVLLMLVGATTLVAQTPAAVAPRRMPPTAPTPPMPASSPMTPDNLDLLNEINLSRTYVDDAYMNRAFAQADLADVNDRVSEAMNNMSFAFGSGLESGPVAWDRQDPADSLYREARDMLNRGDYRKAAELFKALPQRFPQSVYVGDAEYWQAFSLYRIGGTPELQQALMVLAARQPAPDDSGRQRVDRVRPARTTAHVSDNGTGSVASRVSTHFDVSTHTFTTSDGYQYDTDGRRVDAAGLAARIASVLSSRGLAGDPAVKRALAAGGDACDPDDQSVRAEALNALMQNNPATGRQMAVKILANHDECSVPLRRNAVMLVGNERDDAAVSTLVPVAKSDPSESVRMEAMEFLVQNGSDAAISAVIDLSHASGDADIQRSAVEALAQSQNPRARAALRAVIENAAADETLRTIALESFNGDRLTPDDATWLRGIYAKSSSPRVKTRIISLLGRAGGTPNTEWVMGIVRDDSQSLDVRSEALNYAGRNLDVAALSKMYDASTQRPIRQELIALLAQRKEPEALDKLVDIARHGTDPAMRREAISVLARSKDPRASQLLLQLVDNK